MHPSVPSAAVLSGTTSPLSTTITITGSVPSGSVVIGFEVRWQRDTSVGCSDEDEDTFSETGAFPNSYQISGLEPGNRYTSRVTVSNAAGTAPASNSVTATTLETGIHMLFWLWFILSPCESLCGIAVFCQSSYQKCLLGEHMRGSN